MIGICSAKDRPTQQVEGRMRVGLASTVAYLKYVKSVLVHVGLRLGEIVHLREAPAA